MATPKFDTNQWYQIYLGDEKDGQSLVGTSLYTKSGTKGAVFLSPSNTTQPVQRWHIFPVTVNDTIVYTLRSKESGSNGFLGTQYDPEEVTEGKTRPTMLRGDVASDNVFWSFGSWGDGTWYLVNLLNGTNYRMNKKDNGIMAMSPNLTAPQNGQRYSFATIAQVDDVRYSSVNLVGVSPTGSAVSATPSTSSTPTSSTLASPTSIPLLSATPLTTIPADTESRAQKGGISTGAKAGIGAGIAGIVLIVLVVLGLFFWKKRKSGPQDAQPQELGYNTPTKEIYTYQDNSYKHELQSRDVVEVSSYQQPAELPGHLPENTSRVT